MWARLLSGRRSKLAVLAAWLIIASVAGPIAIKLSEVQDNEQLGALPASAEAARAADRLARAFPEPSALVAVAVYARDAGLTAADRAKVEADRAAFAPYAQGGQVAAAEPSADGRALLVAFTLAGDDDTQAAAVEPIKHQLTNGPPDGLRVALTGSAGAEDDLFDAFAGMDAALLLTTAIAVALILILSYRSPVLWLLPLIAVGVASQVASAVVYLLARHAGLTVDLQSQSILTILVFGVGVDYALLLLARYREELREHADRHEAMARAVRRSLPAIAASAATVSLGLLCLVAADLPATRGLGPVCAIGVAAAFLVMTTLLPAFVVLFGRWVFWPFVPRLGAPGAEHRVWRRVAGRVGAAPRATWLVTAAVLVALTAGIANLGLGLPGDKSFTEEVGSVTGQHLIEAHYPAGTVSPALIIVPTGSAGAAGDAARRTAGVAEVLPAETSSDGQWTRLRAVLTDPPESDAAVASVRRLRDAVHPTGALVGGPTAYAVDTRDTAARDDRLIMPLILTVVFVVLVLLLRALVAPLVLLASVVLSYFAALGAAGLILSAMGYPDLWEAIPLQTFLFLVALGVDYTIFLMTRAREEVARTDHRTGILAALTVTGGVITSAGVVLAATFAALTVLPLVPSVQTAVIVVVGVLLDTFLVRTLLVPALALHIGRRIWWPGRLARPAPAPPPPARQAVPIS
ncbi:MMPL family transporter [Luedemannella helvata]|uniref:MMPL family transporter n=1 Tax=Luedemannella helvata TaxID=349315 RepID=A0ABP4VUS8_9ACTN